MKFIKAIILNLLLSLLLLSGAKAQRYTINCTAETATEKSKAILKINGKSETLTFKNGKFTIEGLCSSVGNVELEIDYQGNHHQPHRYPLFLSEGIINIKITDVNGEDQPEITGNKNAVDFEYKLRRPVRELNAQARITGRKVNAAGGLGSEGAKEIQKVLDQQVDECFQIPVKYIKANLDSPVSIEALNFMGNGDPTAKITPTDLEILFSSLSPAIRNSEEGIKCAEKLNKMLSK